MDNIEQLRDLIEFFNDRVHDEHINVEFCSGPNNFYSFIYTEDGSIFEGRSENNLYEAFYRCYCYAFGQSEVSEHSI